MKIMSEEEIMKLEGRELDAAVAMFVFGWKWYWSLDDPAVFTLSDAASPCCWREFDYNDFRPFVDEDSCTAVPDYSTDIKLAFSVVNALVEIDVDFGLQCRTVKLKTHWEAIFFLWKNDHPIFAIMSADTIEKAICLAALHAHFRIKELNLDYPKKE